MAVAPDSAGTAPLASTPLSVTCWDCDAPNPPERMFCVRCGTFIAVGSKAFSRGTYAGSPDAMPAMPGGTQSLGSYAIAMQRRAERRRLLLTAASVALVAVVGLASLYVATSPHDGSDPAGLAGVPAATAERASPKRPWASWLGPRT